MHSAAFFLRELIDGGAHLVPPSWAWLLRGCIKSVQQLQLGSGQQKGGEMEAGRASEMACDGPAAALFSLEFQSKIRRVAVGSRHTIFYCL